MAQPKAKGKNENGEYVYKGRVVPKRTYYWLVKRDRFHLCAMQCAERQKVIIICVYW